MPTKASLLRPGALLTRIRKLDEPHLVETANEVLTGLRVVKATYDFSVDGGATGTIALTSAPIPTGYIVVGGFVQVSTAITGGATLAVTVQAANDIISAAADSGAPWSTTGLKAIVPKANTPESTGIALTAPRNISVVISVAAVTAGKFSVYLYLVPGE